MSFRCAAKSDIGMRRTVNQDSLLCNPEENLFIIADGLGGHKGGEVASSLAIESLSKTIPKISNQAEYGSALKVCVEKAGKTLFDSAFEDPELAGMGTTVTLASVQNDLMYIAQVGDSRAYLIRPPHIWQLTEDHSFVQEQVRAGIITLETARSHQFKNVITRSLGNEPIVDVDLFTRWHMQGDIYLLCSDGLTGHVKESEMVEIIEKNTGNWDSAVSDLVNLANERGGDDNCSVIVFSIEKT